MNEHISRILNSPHRDKVLIAIGSLLIGAGSGFTLGFRRGRVHTEEEVDRIDAAVRQATNEYRLSDLPNEIIVSDPPEPLILDAEAFETITSGEQFMKRITSEEALSSPESNANDIIDISLLIIDDEPEIITHNVFAGTDDDWDHDEEMKDRSEDKPYILHKDEFYENEKEYTQVTLTYYAGDNIIATEDNQIVYNHEDVTGPLRFGHGSGDMNLLFVRNDKSKAEYEIVRHEGLFTTEVLGLEIEDNARAGDLRHDRMSKFRPD